MSKFRNTSQYSFKQFIRNPKRSLAIMAGVIISAMLVNGIFVAGESLMGYSINTGLNDVNFDLIMKVPSDVSQTTIYDAFTTVQTDYDDLDIMESIYASSSRVFLSDPPQQQVIPETIKNQLGVGISTNNQNTTVNTTLDQLLIAGTDISFLMGSDFSEILSFTNSDISTLKANEILIDSDLASRYNLEIGDDISLTGFWTEGNYSTDALLIRGIFTVNDLDSLFTVFYPDDFKVSFSAQNRLQRNVQDILQNFLTNPDRLSNFIIGNTECARNIIADVSSTAPEDFIQTIEYRYTITFAHENLPIYDLQKLNDYVDLISNRLIIEIGNTDTEITNYISDLIDAVENQISVFEVLSLIVSVPTIMLGIFLTDTMFNLFLEQRRREFGLMKSHGSTSRLNTKIFVEEALMVSAVGSVLGSLASIGVSYGIISFILKDSYPLFLETQSISVNWGLMITTVIITTVVSLYSVIKPIKRFSNLNVVESNHYYNQTEATMQSKSKLDWVALIVGLLPLLFLFFDLTSQNQRGIGGALINLLSTLSTALTWISPFLLIYGFIKIVVGRSVPRLHDFSQKIASIFIKEKADLVANSIIRNPKRTTRLIFIIGITICFGFISTIVTASQEQYEYDQIYNTVGADLQIKGATGVNQTFSENILQYSDDINDVASISEISGSLVGTTTQRINIVGINSNELLNVSEINSKYLDGKNADDLFALLDQKENAAIVSSYWAESTGFEFGDLIPVVFTTLDEGNLIVQFEIIGYAEMIPGVATLNSQFQGNIVVNDLYLHQVLDDNVTGFSTSYLVDIVANPNEKAKTIATNLQNSFGNEITSIVVFDDLITTYQQRQGAFVSALDLMSFQFPFLLIISTLGIFVITYLSVIEKRREMALFRVKGTSKIWLERLQLMEGGVMILFGTIVGLIGIPMAYVLNLQLDSMNNAYSLTGISRDFVVPIGTIIIELLAIMLGFMLTVFLTTILESKKSDVGPITDILRNY